MSEANESKGAVIWHLSCDDGIVVRMHWLYILRCVDESLYIGETNDIPQRVNMHNAGLVRYTANLRPVRLAYSEEFPTRWPALKREQQLKRWTRAKKEALIAGDVRLLKRL